MRPQLLLRVALLGFVAGWWTCTRALLLAAGQAVVDEAEKVTQAAGGDA